MSNRYKTAEPAGRSKKNADRYSRRSRRNRVGTFFLVVQALMSVAFMGVVLLLNMLPAGGSKRKRDNGQIIQFADYYPAGDRYILYCQNE